MAMIYGANASGKSNLIRAFFNLVRFILAKPNVGERVEMYEPFLFDINTKRSDAKFEIDFITNSVKHTYCVIFNAEKIVEETLFSFPNSRQKILFTRSSDTEQDSNIHTGILGSDLGNKKIKIFNNQLLLSKFGSDEPIAELTAIYLYFKNYDVINSENTSYRRTYIQKEVSEILYKNEILKNKMDSLLTFADTKLKAVSIQENKDAPAPDGIKRGNISNGYSLFGVHPLYDNSIYTGSDQQLSFNQESVGTQVLFSLGGKVLLTLENGGVLIVDEMDVSLHPFLTRMIILMFQSDKLNPQNAQLIFTSHDMTLLDRDLVRRDQVWITQKNENGASEMFSIQDFDGVREETPFDKWYLAGKFGGLPSLKSIDLMFENESAS